MRKPRSVSFVQFFRNEADFCRITSNRVSGVISINTILLLAASFRLSISQQLKLKSLNSSKSFSQQRELSPSLREPSGVQSRLTLERSFSTVTILVDPYSLPSLPLSPILQILPSLLDIPLRHFLYHISNGRSQSQSSNRTTSRMLSLICSEEVFSTRTRKGKIDGGQSCLCTKNRAERSSRSLWAIP